jgi:hypothetical protein
MIMMRRKFIALVGGATVAWPFSARAQQPAGTVWRIGVLEQIAPALNAANFDALRNGLAVLGYIEGQNLVVEYRSADGRIERFPELAAELVRLKVDVILTRGTPAVLAAKAATATIPIVMAVHVTHPYAHSFARYVASRGLRSTCHCHNFMRYRPSWASAQCVRRHVKETPAASIGPCAGRKRPRNEPDGGVRLRQKL